MSTGNQLVSVDDGLIKEIVSLRTILVTIGVSTLGILLVRWGISKGQDSASGELLKVVGGAVVAAAILSLLWDLTARRMYSKEIIKLAGHAIAAQVQEFSDRQTPFVIHANCQDAFNTLERTVTKIETLDISAETSGSWLEWARFRTDFPKHVRVLLLIDPQPPDKIRSGEETALQVLSKICLQWEELAKEKHAVIELRIIEYFSAFYMGIGNNRCAVLGALSKQANDWCWNPGSAVTVSTAASSQAKQIVAGCVTWFEVHWGQGKELRTVLDTLKAVSQVGTPQS